MSVSRARGFIHRSPSTLRRLSPKFAVQVSQWVYDWMSGTPPTIPDRDSLSPPPLCCESPECVGRSLLDPDRDDTVADRAHGDDGLHVARAPAAGHLHGRILCQWLRDVHGIDTDSLPTYLHVFEDGRRVWPKAYPEQLLAAFRKHFREEWLPHRAVGYFRGRGSDQYLPSRSPTIAGSASTDRQDRRPRTFEPGLQS
jgi:hypothetical protein